MRYYLDLEIADRGASTCLLKHTKTENPRFTEALEVEIPLLKRKISFRAMRIGEYQYGYRKRQGSLNS